MAISAAPGPTLGIDVGGTKIEIALMDAAGTLLRRHRLSTEAGHGPQRVIAAIVGAVRTRFSDVLATLGAVGVAIAGQVDGDGVVRGAPNLGWTDVPLRAELGIALGVPVVVLNDVRAAAWAEWTTGAGAGASDVVVLFIGTGVGGGVISGGRMLIGASNAAGELGHVTLVAGGRQCHCRNRGCLEAYVGGWAIGERAREAARADPMAGSCLLHLTAGSVERITGAQVAQAFHVADPLGIRLVEETAAYLGAAAVGIVNAFNPTRLVLGGGVIDGLPELVGLAEQEMRARALPSSVSAVTVRPAALANEAPALGAAAVARSLLLTTA
ncbi:MAG: ROK family protein [Gemmatimonadota bacterium]|nr:ROK family protein [Gemmatimonadota bacterium]